MLTFNPGDRIVPVLDFDDGLETPSGIIATVTPIRDGQYAALLYAGLTDDPDYAKFVVAQPNHLQYDVVERGCRFPEIYADVLRAWPRVVRDTCAAYNNVYPIDEGLIVKFQGIIADAMRKAFTEGPELLEGEPLPSRNALENFLHRTSIDTQRSMIEKFKSENPERVGRGLQYYYYAATLRWIKESGVDLAIEELKRRGVK